MPAAVLAFPVRQRSEFSLLELARAGKPRLNIGVLLMTGGKLEIRLRDNFDGIELDEEDREYLLAFVEHCTLQIAQRGATEFLAELEDSLSNFLQLSERELASGSSLDKLYERFVEQEKVLRFITHLPVYTLQAAAGLFGEDSEVSESGWQRVDGLKLTEGMFIAQVVGRSMEPLIPDGSFCVFRSPVVGSRQGKRVLVELFGATDSSARYTVKRYTSQKRLSDNDEWEHAVIRLEPLNPEYPAFDLEDGTFRVIAEFVRVLPD